MIPVNIITGFLGSGKTTLLREILRQPSFVNAAVIVNEFGEVGLDHVLLEQVEEGVLLLENGCICCTIRSDLQETLHSLQYKASRDLIPRFDRVFIETTGLADPAPILSTLLAEPMIRNHFRAGNIHCTVDAIAGIRTLENHGEAVKQVAVAERILLTKSDLCAEDRLQQIENLLAHINPFAQMIRTTGEGFDGNALFAHDVINDAHRLSEVGKWLDKARTSSFVENEQDAHHHHTHHHSDAFNSFVVTIEPSIDWVIFANWLTALLHRHGDKILRVKGILNVNESETPLVMQCVQHVVHPPLHLAEWPAGERSSQLVFITQGIEEPIISRSLKVFLSLTDNSLSREQCPEYDQRSIVNA